MRLNHCSVVVVLIASLAACGGQVSGDPTGQGAVSGAGDSTATPATPGGTIATPAVPTDTAPPAPTDTAPPVPVVDHGAPSSTYPAFKPDIAQLIDNGGDVLKAPVIVTVTFDGDANAADYESFGDGIGGSDYWKTIVSEYGVGPAISGETNHVRMTEKMADSVADTDLDTWVADHATNLATSKWPAPTDQTIYVIYLPTTTSLSLNGSDACTSGIGGYHTSTTVGGKEVAYAILPQCDGGGGGGASLLDMTTVSSSHEIGEAATDPHPQTSRPGYYGVDNAHIAWEFFMRNNVENGDLCEVYRDQYLRPKEPTFGFAVQRQWSNKSALAGHNPCVPAPSSAYFNVVPLEPEDVTIDLSKYGSSKRFKTKGYHVAVGETKSFSVGFYSDAATKGPWTIHATQNTAFGSAKKPLPLDIQIDKADGVNGEKAIITVKVLAAGASKSELLTIVSVLGTQRYYMPLMISSD